MLAGTIDSGKGLFVEETDHVVPSGNLLHNLHSQLIVVAGGVRFAINGGLLMLGRGHLVVLGLGQNAQFPQFFVQFLHVGGDTGLDRTEIVVLQFLTLGRLSAKEGASRKDQVLTLVIHIFINQEVFLLGSHLADYLLHVRVAKETQHPDRLPGELFYRSRKSWGCRGFCL